MTTTTVPDEFEFYPGLYENTTDYYEGYYDDYEESSFNFTNSIDNLSKCSKQHTEQLCGLITQRLGEISDQEQVDLYDGAESAWIWTSFSVFTPLCILGIIGNILTIILFAKFIKKTTTSVFIIALAVVDLTVCSTSMPIWLFTVLNGNHDTEVLCKLDKLIYFLAIPLSGGILLIISLDRFILIFLMKTKVMTTLRAKISILLIGLVCLAFAIPQMMSFSTMISLPETFVKFTCDGSISCPTSKCSQTIDYVPQHVSYYLFQSLMIVYVVLVVVFVVLYSLIFCKVYTLYKKMARWRGRHSFHVTNVDIGHATFASESNGDSSSGDRSCRFTEVTSANSNSVKKMNDSPPPYLPKAPPTIVVVKKKKRKPPHLQTALTLFLVTFCFVLAYAPMILMMFMGSCGQKQRNSNSYVNICSRKDYRRFIWHFYFINHVTNPIIYSFMHPRFKESLKSCFRKFCKPCS